MKKCSVEGCDGKHHALGFCNKHWKQYKKYGKIMDEEYDKAKICSVEECNEKHFGLGFCKRHYAQYKNMEK